MKKYQIIYADPPWSYRTWARGAGNGNVLNHYETMTAKEIQGMNIGDLCDDACVLLMWVTFPTLLGGVELIRKWGFTYKTNAFTWIKRNKKADSLFWGLGYYTRANAEVCLLATRGKVLPRISHKVHSVIESRIEGHSKKPEEARKRIVELFGDVPRIELFARQKTEGWDVWGNEVECDIDLLGAKAGLGDSL